MNVRIALSGLLVGALLTGGAVAVAQTVGTDPGSYPDDYSPPCSDNSRACIAQRVAALEAEVDRLGDHYREHSHDSPTPTPDPTPTPTPSSTPTPPGSWACVDSGYGASCPYEGQFPHGGYLYPAIVNSNGWNTYVNADCWANPQCDSLLEANGPGDWQVTTTEEAGNLSVRSYPDVQQLFTNWCPTNPGWGDCGGQWGYTPVAGLGSLSSTYSVDMNAHAGTAAQAAWDIWMQDGTELMIWVDEVGRGSGGATECGSGTLSGHAFTYYVYGGSPCNGGIPIIKLDQNLSAGTIDLLAVLHYFQARGQIDAGAAISQINFGFEVCSTGGIPETFQLFDYAISASVA